VAGSHRNSAAPLDFARAVASLGSCSLRPEIALEPISPPQRLAPWSHAISAEVDVGTDVPATGRLVLLGDPDSVDAWGGTLRLVTYASTELDADMANDPLLAEVAWSWLIEALTECGARYTAPGGTVTQTASARFGDLAGPAHTVSVEIRASWTPLDPDLRPHLTAWSDLLCTAAGLPPSGVVNLPGRTGAAHLT
jgi:hypothetical protein